MGRSYLTVLVCQALAAAAAIAGLRFLALYVDPDTFGRYALYQSVVSAGGLLIVSWPNAALLRFGREEWTSFGRVGVTLAARVLLFTASTIVAIALAWAFDPWLRTLLHVERSPLGWIALGLVVTSASELLVYLHQTVGHSEMYGYTPVITRGGFLIGLLLIPAFQARPDWTYLALCMAVSTVAAGAYAIVALPRSCWSEFRLKARSVWILLQYSWTLPFAGISTYVVNWIDSWVIRDLKGMSAVGVYSWSYQVTAIATLAFAPIAVVLTPRVIDARLNGDAASLKRYVDAIVPTAALMAVAIAVGLTFVFPALRWVAAPSYAAGYPVILILLSALPFQLIAYLVTPLGNAYERILPRFVLVSAVIAVLNTCGDLLLVPRLGISGAAISTSTAFAIGALLQVRVVRAASIEFAPLWRYAIPALIVVPAVTALQWAGPATGGLLVGIGVFAGLVLTFAYLKLGRSGETPLVFVVALGNALTLAGSTAAVTPARAD